MILRDFLTVFNFRNFISDGEDINIIRVYLGVFPKEYFEIGLDSWSNEQEKIIDKIFKPELLISEIHSINYRDNILEIRLEDEEDEEDYYD